MNEVMTRRWNSKVNDGDLVIHLGDFALSWNVNRIKEVREKLKGRILLILGNHDRQWKLEQCDITIAGSYVLKINNLLLTHRPLRDIYNGGSVNVHGHIHNLRRTYGRRINASVEVTNYEPVEIERYFAMADKILEREHE
jgi:calcineurin-like phosphoesterase family protein